MSWIPVTPRLQNGLEIVSQIDNAKFRSLVNRVCQSLHTGTNEKIFNAEEEEKLQISLNVKKDELKLLLDTIVLIYSQAAFGVVKPAIMESVMKETFPISEEKISIFVNAWITHAKSIIDVLRHKSIFPNRIDSVNWSLNVQAASSITAQDAKPLVLLQLGLTGSESKRLTVEMKKSSLTELYNNLEKIQSQLDALK